jgi:hypothetical protein
MDDFDAGVPLSWIIVPGTEAKPANKIAPSRTNLLAEKTSVGYITEIRLAGFCLLHIGATPELRFNFIEDPFRIIFSQRAHRQCP